MPETMPYRNEPEIMEVVRRFEACEYTAEEFVHAKHLTVAAHYILRLEPQAAEATMRTGLLRFIEHHGKNAYHETITLFWLHMVSHLASASQSAGLDETQIVNAVVARCGDKKLINEYYSRELLASPEAKAAWIEPDLKMLPNDSKI